MRIIIFVSFLYTSISSAYDFEVSFRKMYDRDLEVEKSPLNLTKMEIDRFSSIELKLNYNFLETTIGYTKAEIEDVRSKGYKYKVKDNEGPVIGIGVGISKSYGKYILGIKGTYRYHKIGDYMYEFEVQPVIGRKIGRFLYYFSILYSDFKIKDGNFKFKAEENPCLKIGFKYQNQLFQNVEIIGFPERKRLSVGNKSGFDGLGVNMSFGWIF